MAFFLGEKEMNIFIYSDESGVMDVAHNEYFVFAGLILLSTKEKDGCGRQFASVERMIRKNKCVPKDYELKAARITPKEKGKLFRSLNKWHKFGVVIHEKQINDNITADKKSRQRYLDYAYKIAVKRALKNLIDRGDIMPAEVERIYFRIDEHSTATNGVYELRESLEQEFKRGIANYEKNSYFPPIFPDLQDLQLQYCNSEAELLVRASDIIANRLYFLVRQGRMNDIRAIQNLNFIELP